MIKIEIKDGMSTCSGDGTGIDLAIEGATLVAALYRHFRKGNPVIANFYEYIVTNEVKKGTLFDDNDKDSTTVFKGTVEEFFKRK